MHKKQKRKPRKSYHWDNHALSVLLLQSIGFVAFIIWCFAEHVPPRYSLPPTIIGSLIFAALFLYQVAKARCDDHWWDDDNCSSWRGY